MRRKAPLSLLVRTGEDGPTVFLGEESREAAEAAQPPSADSLKVLRAARDVHAAETALRTVTRGEELVRLRSALEKAEEALRAALARLGDDSGTSG